MDLSLLSQRRHFEALEDALMRLYYLRVDASECEFVPNYKLRDGDFGQGLLAILRRPGQAQVTVSVKKLAIPYFPTPGPYVLEAYDGTAIDLVEAKQRLAKELTVWAKLSHSNILNLVGFHLPEHSRDLHLMSPYMANGNVTQYVKNTYASVECRLKLVHGITAGMAFLHIQDPAICHGHLIPDNVLVSSEEEAILSGFGPSRITQDLAAPIGLKTRVSRLQAIGYMSPELIEDPYGRQTLSSDVWAWACTVFFTMTNCAPYQVSRNFGVGMRAVVLESTPGSRELLDDLITRSDRAFHPSLKALKDTFQMCWQRDPRLRPTLAWLQENYPLPDRPHLVVYQQLHEDVLKLNISTSAHIADEALVEESIQDPLPIIPSGFNSRSPKTAFQMPEQRSQDSMSARSVTPADAVRSTLQILSHLEISADQLMINSERELGFGGAAKVVHGILHRDSQSAIPVAVKKLYISRPKGIRLQIAMRLARELNVWAKLKHPNILELVGFYIDENYSSAQIISLYMSHGNVKDVIGRTRPNIDIRSKLVLGITAGVLYLHTRDPPICHGDLKPANVLVTDQGDAVLCDFGLARLVEESDDPSGLTTTLTMQGTLCYMSPELVEGEAFKHSLPSDVWAWACTVFEVITDHVPYSNKKKNPAIILAISGGTPPGPIEDFYAVGTPTTIAAHENLVALRDLIPRCWSLEPSERPTLVDINDYLPPPESQSSP